MSWDAKGANGPYFYFSVREGDRTRKVYAGRGPLAEELSARIEQGRRDRLAAEEALREEREGLATAEGAFGLLRELAGLLARAALLAGNCYQHKGQWRRRRMARTFTTKSGATDPDAGRTTPGVSKPASESGGSAAEAESGQTQKPGAPGRRASAGPRSRPAPPPQPATPPPARPDLTRAEALREMARRAAEGDEASRAALRDALDKDPAVWRAAGDAGALAERCWVDAVAGGDELAGQCLSRRLKELKAQLAGPDPTPLEGLLVGVIGVAWLATQQGEIAASRAEGTCQQVASRLRRAESGQRRFLHAAKTLAVVRALLTKGLNARRPGEGPACLPGPGE